eukprot:CAMPEP_0119475088 /NCGR_PEP_ID=MMETSP1344-20130328/6112_1 /TAXON_ID=236787 /ORGANISM="Florenciella parvula, Strain CCMP2471" /LENGTH=154 /DNA_ID=CAMNT_0007508535 /DNA_START=613 /DNA_END=1077 /DNA_ORIENTATION=-
MPVRCGGVGFSLLILIQTLTLTPTLGMSGGGVGFASAEGAVANRKDRKAADRGPPGLSSWNIPFGGFLNAKFGIAMPYGNKPHQGQQGRVELTSGMHGLAMMNELEKLKQVININLILTLIWTFTPHPPPFTPHLHPLPSPNPHPNPTLELTTT